VATYLATPGWSASTRATYFGHLVGFYRWAEGMHLDYNPMERLRRPQAPRGAPRPIARKDLDLLLTIAPDWLQFAALIASKQGLRCKEIAGVGREDITEEWTFINEAKGGRAEKVPTDPEVWTQVQDYPLGSVIEHLGGVADAQWVSNTASGYMRRVLKLKGETGLHACRHWYATELRRAGHDLFVIQRLMRHRSTQSTQVYVDVQDEERRLAVASLPALTPRFQQAH
jgi:integrase/recombinase XerD